MAFYGLDVFGREAGEVLVAAHHHLADHAGQAHLLAVFRAINAGDAVGMQLADFRRHDDTATAAKHLDVLAAPALEQIDHVLEILDMPALVRADGNALRVFLQGCGDHLINAAVVPQMDNLCTHALQNAAHDVDGRVMPVKKGRGGDKAYLVCRSVAGERLVFCGEIGHGFSWTVALAKEQQTGAKLHPEPVILRLRKRQVNKSAGKTCKYGLTRNYHDLSQSVAPFECA